MEPTFPDPVAGAARLLAWTEAGGPVAALLLALSIFALTLILAKAWQFARAGLGDRAAETALARLAEDRPEAADLALARSTHPAAAALAARLSAARSGAAPPQAREAGRRAGERALDPLRDWLRALEVTASLAPLLGLFGTVLGMIDAFAAMEAAGASVNPAVLSGGIWTALLTTAGGLAVAMPAAAAFNWLDRRVERAEAEVDDALSAPLSTPAAAPANARAPHALRAAGA